MHWDFVLVIFCPEVLLFLHLTLTVSCKYNFYLHFIELIDWYINFVSCGLIHCISCPVVLHLRVTCRAQWFYFSFFLSWSCWFCILLLLCHADTCSMYISVNFYWLGYHFFVFWRLIHISSLPLVLRLRPVRLQWFYFTNILSWSLYFCIGDCCVRQIHVLLIF